MLTETQPASRVESFRVPLEPSEVAAIQRLVGELARRFPSTDDPAFADEASLLAHELPRRVRRQLLEFRLQETRPLLILAGYPIDNTKIGRTPEHWKYRQAPPATHEEDILLVLFGSLLGEPIAWSTQQDGYLVHDILPIKGHEQEQLGSGSETLLTWHTEDAFHPYRGDYLGMLCLRNPDHVPTTVACVDELDIPEPHRGRLFEARYTIRPDESHLAKNRGKVETVDPTLERAYRRIEQMNTRPEKIPVLLGDPASPYLRLDPYFMDRLPEDPEAQESLDYLTAEVDAKIWDLPLDPGDYCFIDNFRAVHGRKPFKARYDGQDRWMKRINIVRDLRKSRDGRRSAGSRLIL